MLLKYGEDCFVTDQNKTFGERVWEISSRFTWQLPQTVIGFVAAHKINTYGHMNWVKYKYGATISNTNGHFGAFTLGSYINGDEDIKTNANNKLFQHEYCHYIQSQAVGRLYLPKYALPSLTSAIMNDYYEYVAFWAEQDANVRANKYFDKKYGYLQTNTGIVNPKWWEYTLILGGFCIHPWLIIYS